MKAFGLGYCCASAWACYGITKAQLPEGVKKAWPDDAKAAAILPGGPCGNGTVLPLGLQLSHMRAPEGAFGTVWPRPPLQRVFCEMPCWVDPLLKSPGRVQPWRRGPLESQRGGVCRPKVTRSYVSQMQQPCRGLGHSLVCDPITREVDVLRSVAHANQLGCWSGRPSG